MLYYKNQQNMKSNSEKRIKQKTNSNMTEVSPSLLVIILNVHGLNSPIKRLAE